MNTDYKHGEMTEKIIRAAYTVYNAPSHGFLDKVYHNALALELKRAVLQFQQQYPVPVRYREELVGDFVADLIVDEKLVV